MLSKGNAPNARQKEWREWVRGEGCRLCPWASEAPTEIHHVIGATGKHLKLPIGHEFILGLCKEHHDVVGAMPVNTQKELFIQLATAYYSRFNALPFAPEKLLAIWDYHK